MISEQLAKINFLVFLIKNLKLKHKLKLKLINVICKKAINFFNL